MDYMPRTRKLFKFMGFVPPKTDNKIYYLSQYLQQIVLTYILTGGIVYIPSVIGNPKILPLTKIEVSLALMILTTLCYGYLSIYYIKHDVVTIFEKIESMNEYGYLEKAKHLQDLFDYIHVFLVGFCGFGAFLVSVTPLFDIKNCTKYNLEHNTKILCGFCVGLRYPYDISSGFLYYMHWMLVFFVVMSFVTKGTVFIGLTISFYLAITWRCEDLCDQLRMFNTHDDFNERRKCLYHCIYYHNRIIELADYINGRIAWVTFPCIVSHNIIIGIGFLGMMTGFSVISSLPTITWIGGLFIGCYIGDKVIEASTEIATVAYDLDWYKDTKLRRDILIMILRAQKPIRLECGKFGELSMSTFKNIMQGAYAYATMRSP